MSRWNKRRHVETDEPSVNLTPLIDVVFCILIMFIVVAPFLELDQVQLADAKRDSNERISVQEGGPITIHVHQDNTIWLNQHPVDLVRLIEVLKEEKMRHPEANPYLFHDQRARFGTYQSIKNAVETAGFEKLDIVLKP